jgi:hypothetical protein
MANLDRYLDQCNGSNITLTVRPAVSALTIGYFPGLLQYCLDRNLMVKSLLVTKPDFLNAVILPKSVKDQYLESYQQLMDRLPDSVQIPIDYNASDPHNTAMIVKEQGADVHEYFESACTRKRRKSTPAHGRPLSKVGSSVWIQC